MIGTIIYVIGIVVTVMAVIDVFKKNISPVKLESPLSCC